MKTILRNFLFLNTALMADYLSTLEGHILEGAIDQTESGKKEKGGKLGYKVIEGSAISETSTETKQQLAVPDAAKFQRLYELLEEQDQIQYLDAFDQEIWNQLRRNELLEIQATVRLPEMFSMTQLVEGIVPLVDLMALVGKDPLSDPETRTAVDGMREVTKLVGKKPIPLLFEAASTPNYRFVANLPRQHLRCELSDFQGEAVVFGKVLRILAKGQKLEVFSLLPGITSIPKRGLTKEQRRRMKASKNELTEWVRGPAIVLDPLAVYR